MEGFAFFVCLAAKIGFIAGVDQLFQTEARGCGAEILSCDDIRRYQKHKSASPPKPTSEEGLDFDQNLRRLDQLANLGLISASLAHEIKNSLVAIKTYVEILLEKGEDKEMAEVVRRELKRIDSLATQMLRLSAPKGAARRDRAGASDPRPRAAAAGTPDERPDDVLKRDYRASSDTVCGDESQLQQAFMNLVLNGLEAIGDNGELTVRTELLPAMGRAAAENSNSGHRPGIAAENCRGCSSRFSRRRKTARVWGWRSASASSANTAATFRRTASRPGARRSTFFCRQFNSPPLPEIVEDGIILIYLPDEAIRTTASLLTRGLGVALSEKLKAMVKSSGPMPLSVARQ